MAKQKTLYEKWEMDSQEPDGGIRFHDAPEGAKPVELVGFSDEEMKEILGEEGYQKYQEKRNGVDEIDEV